MLIHELLTDAIQQLEQAKVPNPTIDAEWLLAQCLNCRRIDLHMHGDRPMPKAGLRMFQSYLERRCRREPLQYIMGTQEFYGRPFVVTPAVLIPRPETERLVEHAIRVCADHAWRVLDIGTGSGCIAVTLALESPGLHITAVDQSVAALTIAKQNATDHLVIDRIRLLEADLVPDNATEPFDLIVSNPPYCCATEWPTLQPEVRNFEPKDALISGDDGLTAIERIIAIAPDHLRPGGWLMLEIGRGQAEAVEKMIEQSGKYETPKVKDDYNAIARFIAVRVAG